MKKVFLKKSLPIKFMLVFSLFVLILNSCSNAQDSFEKACHHIKKGDFSTAHKHLNVLAKNKHAKAQTLMGLFHEKGIVVKKDVNQAVSYYRQAANQGLPQAQSRLGHLLLDTVGKDSQEAIQWLEKAAARGEADAQSTLAKLGKLGPPSNMQNNANSFSAGLQRSGAQYKSGMDNLSKSWVGYADIVNALNQASAAPSEKR